MRTFKHALVVGFLVVALVGVELIWFANTAREQGVRPPNLRGGPTPSFRVELEGFEDGGNSTAARYMEPIKDPNSLAELRAAVKGRGKRGIATLEAQYAALKPSPTPTRAEVKETLTIEHSLGLLCMYEGNFPEASAWIKKALATAKSSDDVPTAYRAKLMAVLGTISLRRGEIENCLGCVGPSSCIFPIAKEAVHKNQEGSREAIEWFTAYLKEEPGDLRAIWLLNIAYMTLGEYPGGVPKADLLPLASFRSKLDAGRFANVATQVGLSARGPNLAGGSVFDDFNGDGLMDLFTTSLDADKGASLFVNKGDGTFEARSDAIGLGDQVYALNVTRADFDNDGDLDVLLLRGAWETPMRPSLLRNKGDGSFEDITKAAGMDEPIQSESAAWGDYDGDGKLDVFVCGEFVAPGAPDVTSTSQPDLRNACRLYHNEGNGTFRDVAIEAGVTNDRCGKGSAWGDYDGDGKLDLFVSNMGQKCRMYHNEGGGRFKDVGPALGLTGPPLSFACWFWDYDNDGKLDLYVNDYRARPAEVLASVLGLPASTGAPASRPALYKNLGASGFKDVTKEVGLDRAMAPMGSNFGDIDNDGFLDIHLGTGDMSYSGLDVNLTFKNVGGMRFEDVTDSTGTGHLQKGHGVSFADWDGDGDLDMFAELGGAAPGDQGYNALFQNPGHAGGWLKVKLVGTKTNRSAIGASIRARMKGADGSTWSVYRTIGNNSSFGGNSLTELIGMAGATEVAELIVTWPGSGTTQTFKDVAGGRLLEITEGKDRFEVKEQKVLKVPPAKP